MYALQEQQDHWRWENQEKAKYNSILLWETWHATMYIGDFRFYFCYNTNSSMYWCAEADTWKRYPQFQSKSYASSYTLAGTGLFPRVAKLMEELTRDFLLSTRCRHLTVFGAEIKRINFYRNVMPTWRIDGYTTEPLNLNGIKFVRID